MNHDLMIIVCIAIGVGLGYVIGHGKGQEQGYIDGASQVWREIDER